MSNKVNYRRRHRARKSGKACSEARGYGHQNRCAKGKCSWCESNRTAAVKRQKPKEGDEG